MNFTFQVVSPKWGPFTVTAPERFRPQIEWRSWYIMRDSSRHDGQQFTVATRRLVSERRAGQRESFYLHTFIWELAGKRPVKQIDHKDRNQMNNAEDNLRDGSKGNSRNRDRLRNNTSGVTGVIWHKRDCRWDARIRVDGKRLYLGQFDSIADATSARDAAVKKYHGEFGVLSSEAQP